MGKSKKPFNPFYVLLVVVGVAFTLSAAVYSIEMVRANRGPAYVSSSTEAAEQAAESGLVRFMSDYGDYLLLGEILLLAVATFGAIATDRYWAERHKAASRGTSRE